MARIRTVKPAFFRHESIFEAEKATGLPLRIAFIGLWTAADREGRFRWKPRELKLDCLPYDEVDFAQVLDALCAAGFIQRYEVAGETYGYIPSWARHQQVNAREAQSTLPGPDQCEHVHAREEPVQACGEGKGREQEGKGKEDAAPSARVSVPDDADLYRRGKEILGTSSGGLIRQLLKVKGGNIAIARAALEVASTKHNPREYIAGCIRGDPAKDDARARGDAW